MPPSSVVCLGVPAKNTPKAHTTRLEGGTGWCPRQASSAWGCRQRTPPRRKRALRVAQAGAPLNRRWVGGAAGAHAWLADAGRDCPPSDDGRAARSDAVRRSSSFTCHALTRRQGDKGRGTRDKGTRARGRSVLAWTGVLPAFSPPGRRPGGYNRAGGQQLQQPGQHGRPSRYVRLLLRRPADDREMRAKMTSASQERLRRVNRRVWVPACIDERVQAFVNHDPGGAVGNSSSGSSRSSILARRIAGQPSPPRSQAGIPHLPAGAPPRPPPASRKARPTANLYDDSMKQVSFRYVRGG